MEDSRLAPFWKSCRDGHFIWPHQDMLKTSKETFLDAPSLPSKFYGHIFNVLWVEGKGRGTDKDLYKKRRL